MNLQDILDAPLNYDQDLYVSHYFDDNGFWSGFRCAVYDATQQKWEPEGRRFATPKVNELLVSRGYRPINKRTRQVPFDVYWDYRLFSPSWEVFRNWLLTYSLHELERVRSEMDENAKDPDPIETFIRERGIAEKSFYEQIVDKLESEHPKFDLFYQWIMAREKDLLSSPNRHEKYHYQHLRETLVDYQDMIGLNEQIVAKEKGLNK